MMDREKVIKALGICAGENDFSVCINEKCPYIGGSKDGYCITNLERDALVLLKEQEAVKPKSKSRHGEYPQIVHRCGNCNEILNRHYKYCPTCGRSVK